MGLRILFGVICGFVGIFIIGCAFGNFCTNFEYRHVELIGKEVSGEYNSFLTVEVNNENCTMKLGNYNTLHQAEKKLKPYKIGENVYIKLYESGKCRINHFPGQPAGTIVLWSFLIVIYIAICIKHRLNEIDEEKTRRDIRRDTRQERRDERYARIEREIAKTQEIRL